MILLLVQHIYAKDNSTIQKYYKQGKAYLSLNNKKAAKQSFAAAIKLCNKQKAYKSLECRKAWLEHFKVCELEKDFQFFTKISRAILNNEEPIIDYFSPQELQESLVRLAFHYNAKKKFAEEIRFLLKAIKLTEKHKDKMVFLPKLYLNLAETYLEANIHLEHVKKYIDFAAKTHKSLSPTSANYKKIRYLYGFYYARKNQHNLANKYFYQLMVLKSQGHNDKFINRYIFNYCSYFKNSINQAPKMKQQCAAYLKTLKK